MAQSNSIPSRNGAGATSKPRGNRAAKEVAMPETSRPPNSDEPDEPAVPREPPVAPVSSAEHALVIEPNPDIEDYAVGQVIALPVERDAMDIAIHTPPPQPKRSGIPIGVVVYSLILIFGLLAIHFWPENKEDQRKIDGILRYATTAQALAEKEDYRGAIVQYNVFLAVAGRCESHSRRLESAVENAKEELLRLHSLIDAKGARPTETTQPATTRPAAPGTGPLDDGRNRHR